MLRLKTLSFTLPCLLAMALTAPQSYAENTTGIRLGNTDSGGQRSQSHHTQRNQARPFNNNASDPHVYEHRRQSPTSALGQSNQYHKRGQTYGNNADDPHVYKYRDDSRDYQGHDHKQSYDHDYRPSYGIKGHRSFGLSPQRDHRRKPYDDNHRQYRDYRHDRHYQPNDYRHQSQRGLHFYSGAIGYSAYESGSNTSTFIGYPYTANNTDYNSGLTQTDAWKALGDYKIDTARYAFESLTQHQPDSALPRVGFALSTALSGELQRGAYIMEQAMSADVSDLRYFRADPDLQLIIEELLLSYQHDALMTSSLHYLKQDYPSANQAVSIAANQCQQCFAVINLQSLIEQQP